MNYLNLLHNISNEENYTSGFIFNEDDKNKIIENIEDETGFLFLRRLVKYFD